MTLPNRIRTGVSVAALCSATLGPWAAAPTAVEARADAAPTQEAPRVIKDVVAQGPIGDMACGPCSLYNALLAGGPEYRAAAEAIEGGSHLNRVRTLIETVGSAPSEVFSAPRLRYDEEKGECSEDFEAMANDLLKRADLPRGEGVRLIRGAEEDRTDFLRRVHAELVASASPPVLEIRSFVADAKPSGRSLWDGTGGHYLTVVDVDPIPQDERVSGFLMRCADSWTGRIIPVFAAVERYRGFTST
ncbi:MAG: hypothetical protein AAGG01_21735, partial [Planctomycetota bacterium]